MAEGIEDKGLLQLRADFYHLLQTVGARENVFTIKEVLQYLRLYIESKKSLIDYNSTTPRIVCCQDELGRILDVSAFELKELQVLLRKVVRVLPAEQRNLAWVRPDRLSKEDGSGVLSAAASSELTGSVVVQGPKGQSPDFIFQIQDTPDSLSGDESCYSCQGYSTAYIQDSGWSEEEDEVWVVSGQGTRFEDDCYPERFSVEFDVGSDTASVSSIKNAYSTDSDIPDEIIECIVTRDLLSGKDSDVEFWADSSDNDNAMQEVGSDPEISEADMWKCDICLNLNKPFVRYCMRCWDMRRSWLPERQKRIKPPNMRKRKREPVVPTLRRSFSSPGPSRLRARRELNRQLTMDSAFLPSPNKRKRRSLTESLDLDELTPDTDDIGSSQELIIAPNDTDLATSQQEEPDGAVPSTSGSTDQTSGSLCIICSSAPRTTTLVHTSHRNTGHLVTCYPCGRKLWKKNQPCPLCRDSIFMIIQNYF